MFLVYKRPIETPTALVPANDATRCSPLQLTNSLDARPLSWIEWKTGQKPNIPESFKHKLSQLLTLCLTYLLWGCIILCHAARHKTLFLSILSFALRKYLAFPSDLAPLGHRSNRPLESLAARAATFRKIPAAYEFHGLTFRDPIKQWSICTRTWPHQDSSEAHRARADEWDPQAHATSHATYKKWTTEPAIAKYFAYLCMGLVTSLSSKEDTLYYIIHSEKQRLLDSKSTTCPHLSWRL